MNLLNQEQVIYALTEKNGLAPEINERILNDFLAIVTDCLTRGVPVKLTGFGIFDINMGKPREVVNPQTLEKMNIGYYSRPSFRAGRALKASIKNSVYLQEINLDAESQEKAKKKQKQVTLNG